MLTADTITDEQIRELQREKQEDSFYTIVKGSVISLTVWALSSPGNRINGQRVTADDIKAARARCAEILNARGTKPSYPHTLTSEQFAIISVALDSSREREAAYVAKHPNRDDHLKALDELRKLWAFAGPVVLNARRSA